MPRRKVWNAVPLENEEQADLVKYLELTPWGRDNYFHIANERWIKKEAWRLKSQGVKPGLPDIILLIPIYSFENDLISFRVGMALELKRVNATASALKQNQRDWLLKFQKSHYRCRVSLGWEDAADALKDYAVNRNMGTGEIEIPEKWPRIFDK